MNCGWCDPQTEVSQPGAGRATAKHYRDMMRLRWFPPPRLRDIDRQARVRSCPSRTSL